MALRAGKIVLVASLALLAAATLALAGPLTGTAGASACKRWGSDMPRHLSHRHAKKAIRCLLNKKRENHGVRHLSRNRHLKHAAQGHNHYMKKHRCFSHECPGERSVLSRLQAADYITGGLRAWRYGENIAFGGRHLGTPKSIVRAWMRSPEHKRNILDPAFRQIGIGYNRGIPRKPNAHGAIYTTDFGMRSG
jgi:uncharacterized protein YkwD